MRLPKRLDGLITHIEDGSLAVASPRLERQMARLIRTAHLAVAAVIFGALLIAGSVVRVNDTVLGNVLMIASAFPSHTGCGLDAAAADSGGCAEPGW